VAQILNETRLSEAAVVNYLSEGDYRVSHRNLHFAIHRDIRKGVPVEWSMSSALAVACGPAGFGYRLMPGAVSWPSMGHILLCLLFEHYLIQRHGDI
jgi:hypothetical protein